MSPLLVMMLVTGVDASLEVALQRALTRESAKVQLTAWDAPRCKGSFAPAPFDSSGRVPVRVRGKKCEAWGWAQVRVLLPIATLSRDVKANESMDGAWTVREEEPRGEVMAHVPAGATATRWLRKGMAVGANDVRTGPRPGSPIVVKVMLGALSLEQRGTVAACGNGVCATLPSGKKVTGAWLDGILVVGGGT
ncbi:MAG: hypothetical protein Q8L48_44415 [Archangium sp.]|nr:hypothetical protein [Archangium sp.]